MNSSQHLLIITGASRGLGRALAAQSLAQGHFVIALARHAAPELQESARAEPDHLQQWQADLVDAAPVAVRLQNWLVQCAPDRFAAATLINNAGILPYVEPLREASVEAIARGVRINLEAPMLLTAVFLEGTQAWQGARRVLNISSGLGRRAMASQSGYCATKAGMDMATRCLALEEANAPNGARVCSLAPGVIDTDMQVALRSADEDRFPDRGRFEQLKQGGKLVTAEDTAHRILAYLDSAAFGTEAVADIREIAPA